MKRAQINVRLDPNLKKKITQLGLPISKICRKALEEQIKERVDFINPGLIQPPISKKDAIRIFNEISPIFSNFDEVFIKKLQKSDKKLEILIENYSKIPLEHRENWLSFCLGGENSLFALEILLEK